MTTWNESLLIATAQVTGITAVALALAWSARRRIAWVHALGVVGLVLALASPVLTLALPARTWWRVSFLASSPVVGPQWPSAEAGSPAGQPPGSVAAGTPALPAAEQPARSTVVATSASPGPALVRSGRVSQPGSAEASGTGWVRNWIAVLWGGLWVAGSMVVAARSFTQHRRIRALVRQVLETPQLDRERSDRLRAVSERVRGIVGLRTFPAVRISDRIPMPLVLGLWRPVIVIPLDLLRAGCEAKLREVLIHEAAHVARRDTWVCVLQRVAAIGWWWHPGVALLNRVVNRSREELCDNFVLGCSDPAHYAETLLELAERCSQAGRLTPALGLLEPRWTLESRIKGLLHPGRDVATRIRRRTMAGIVLLLGIVCGVVGGIRAVENGRIPSPGAKHDSSTVAKAAAPEAADPPLRMVTVRGRCLDEDEFQPLTDVRVLVVAWSPRLRRHIVAGETKSGADGAFELKDLEIAAAAGTHPTAVAALPGYASTLVALKGQGEGLIEQDLELSSHPGSLSGTVRDAEGRPVAGVTVSLPCFTDDPLLGIRSAVTDDRGRYVIPDLRRWSSESYRRTNSKTGVTMVTTGCVFHLRHPDYPLTTAMHSAIPQGVDVTLYSPAVVEGRVLDEVTGRPAAGVAVCAQGVARHGWYETTTDADGRYRLRMTRDHYNLWANAADRIAVAAKAIKAERGRTVTGADIRLVGGGFVVGTVLGADGKPISPAKESPVLIAHYGPARPRTGAAVTSTKVEADGTYSLRVAPGRNYVYFMNGSGRSAEVLVADGHDTTLNFDLREPPSSDGEGLLEKDSDERLAQTIRAAAAREDEADSK